MHLGTRGCRNTCTRHTLARYTLRSRYVPVCLNYAANIMAFLRRQVSPCRAAVTSPYPSVLPQRLLRLLRLSHKQGKRLLQRWLVLAWLRGEELLRRRRDGAKRRRERAERRRKGVRTCARSSGALRHGCSGGSSGAKARTCCRPRSACHLELPDARCRAATADAAKRKWWDR